jgi:hypothetical protein
MGSILNPVIAALSEMTKSINPQPAAQPAAQPAEQPAARAANTNVTPAPSRAAVGANADGTSRDMGNIGASGNTMLTGPAGVDESEMSLGKKSLLGA